MSSGQAGPIRAGSYLPVIRNAPCPIASPFDLYRFPCPNHRSNAGNLMITIPIHGRIMGPIVGQNVEALISIGITALGLILKRCIGIARRNPKRLIDVSSASPVTHRTLSNIEVGISSLALRRIPPSSTITSQNSSRKEEGRKGKNESTGN